jgi:hypothetical protein
MACELKVVFGCASKGTWTYKPMEKWMVREYWGQSCSRGVSRLWKDHVKLGMVKWNLDLRYLQKIGQLGAVLPVAVEKGSEVSVPTVSRLVWEGDDGVVSGASMDTLGCRVVTSSMMG